MDAFQKAYYKIINEAWNRFNFSDLIMATALVTNDFKDNWVSAKGPGIPTGKRVLEKMNNSAYKTYGAQLVNTGNLADNNDVSWGYASPSGENYYNGSKSWDQKSIISYWATKSQNGDSFSQEIYRDILKYTNPDNPQAILAVNIGKMAFAIWKACHARVTRQENNIKSLQDQGINLTTEFPYGKKIENLQLTLTGAKNEYKSGYSYYSKGTYSDIVYGIDQTTGIKYKIKSGSKDTIGSEIVRLFAETCHHLPIPTGSDAIKLVVSGKVKGTYPEYKMVSLNYAIFSSPTRAELEAKEKQIEAAEEAKKAAEKAVKLAERGTIKGKLERYRLLNTEFSDIDDSELADEILQQQLELIKTNPNYINQVKEIFVKDKTNKVVSLPVDFINTLTKDNIAYNVLENNGSQYIIDIIKILKQQQN